MTRMLIVENDPTQARMLARAFANLRPDLTVLTSANGFEAMELIKTRGVDLVLTDLQMPDMDGFELLAWLVEHSPGVPVFTMSGVGTDDLPERLNVLGVIEYFRKPLDVKAMLAKVGETLSQSVRGHVHNVSLASFLQLMEMERKTCSLTVNCDEQSGTLVMRKGELIDARTGSLRGDEAAIAIIAWPSPSITITSHAEQSPRAIEKSLGFILMEAMRVQDEAERNSPTRFSNSELPTGRHSFRPSIPLGALDKSTWSIGLANGAKAVAIVDTSTGAVLRSAVKDDCPVQELAAMAAQVLRHEVATLVLCDQSEGIEELVLSTTTRCDVIRPLGATEFALLVYAPDETNLVMARLELDRFIVTRG